MSRCPNCKINVLDNAVMCPLCRSVLERDSDAPAIEESVSVMYPDISTKVKSMILAIRITILAAVVIEAVCILVNYLTFPYKEFRWSLLSGIGLFYGCFSLVISGTRSRSHRRKIVYQLGIWLVLTVIVDYVIGFKGWSIAYGMPISIMAVMVGIGVLMIVMHKTWQSYLYPLIWLFIFSLISLGVSYIIKTDYFRLLNIISALVTGTVLAALIIIGDRKAENELKRRFHM